MKATSRDTIISEIERVLVHAGAKDYDSGMATFEKLLNWLQEHYHPMKSKEDFAALLDSLPEPSWLQMRFLLGSFKYTPHVMRYSLKRLTEMAEDDFPEIPRGRPGLDAYMKAQIVAHVGKRYTEGYALEQAKWSAARKFGISVSTVQRAWDDRGNRDEVDFRSVLKFLAAGPNEQWDSALLDGNESSIMGATKQTPVEPNLTATKQVTSEEPSEV